MRDDNLFFNRVKVSATQHFAMLQFGRGGEAADTYYEKRVAA
jgi:hypothetical protein